MTNRKRKITRRPTRSKPAAPSASKRAGHLPAREASESVGAPIGGTGRHEANPRHRTKKHEMVAMLSRPDGASMSELMSATGWLAHSVRATLTGLRSVGHEIVRSKDEFGAPRYRIMVSA